MVNTNTRTAELALHIHSLPRELKDNILIHLDPVTLAHTRTRDDIIWRKVSLKKEYQQLKLYHTRSHIFSETLLSYINEKYSTIHPLYAKTRQLESLVNSNTLDPKKVKYFFKKITTGEKSDRIAYIKAIIGSDRCHAFIIDNDFFHTPSWIELLESVIPTHPELALWLLTSKPFLETLRLRPYHIISKNLFLTAITQTPVLIDCLLENETVQHILLANKYLSYNLYQLLNASTKGLCVFLDNPALEKFYNRIYSNLKEHNFQDLWFKKLLIDHSESDRFLQQYPVFFQLLTYGDPRRLSKQHPKTFISIEIRLPHSLHFFTKEYLLINFECMYIEDQFKALKQSTQVSDWLTKQNLESFTQFVQASVALDDNQQDDQVEFTKIAKYFNHLKVKPVFIKHENFHIEYLLSKLHRDLITNGQFTLAELLKMSPARFLEGINRASIKSCLVPLLASFKLVPLEVLVQNYGRYTTKLKTLYAVYEALEKDAQDFLDSQQIHHFTTFMQTVIDSQECTSEQLTMPHFENLLSNTLRSMIQTNHISFAKACQLNVLELAKVHSIDANLNSFCNMTQRKLSSGLFNEQEQALHYLLRFTPKFEDISRTLQTLSNIVTSLPSIECRARSAQSGKARRFFTMQATVKHEVTDNISQLTQG